MDLPSKSNRSFENFGADADFKLLRCFVAVVQCGGLTAAGELLNQDTSAISRQIRDLEARLGFSLCKRGRSGFALTPEGSQVYASVRELFGAAERFKSSVCDIKGKLSGELTLGLVSHSSTNSDAHIEDAIAYFKKSAPDVDIKIHFDSVEAVQRGVLDGRCHVGVVPDCSRQLNIEYTPLFSEQVQIYVGVGHEFYGLCDQDIAWSDVLGRHMTALDYQRLDHVRGDVGRLTPSNIGSDLEAIALMVLSGQSLGFMPDHFARPFVEMRRMRPLMPERATFQTTYYCVRPAQAHHSRVPQAFLEALLQAHRPAAAIPAVPMPAEVPSRLMSRPSARYPSARASTPKPF